MQFLYVFVLSAAVSLDALAGGAAESSNSPYRVFLTGKLAQRERFFSRFNNWSMGFLGGW